VRWKRNAANGGSEWHRSRLLGDSGEQSQWPPVTEIINVKESLFFFFKFAVISLDALQIVERRI